MHSEILINCVSQKNEFVENVQAAAVELDAEVVRTSSLSLALDSIPKRKTCVVADFSIPGLTQDCNRSNRIGKILALLAVVPKHETRLAFRAACMGAFNVLDYPFRRAELARNLRAFFTSPNEPSIPNTSCEFNSTPYECLSDRQKDILRLLIKGEPNKRVAANLDIGLRTVESERAKIIRLMDAETFVGLVVRVSKIEMELQAASLTAIRDQVKDLGSSQD